MHAIQTYIDSSLVFFDKNSNKFKASVFAQVVPDLKLCANIKADSNEINTEVSQIDVYFTYNNWHQLEEAEALSLAELIAQMTVASPLFLNSFNLNNGAPTTSTKLICSQLLSKAMINSDLLTGGEFKDLSQAYQVQSMLPSIYFITSPAYTAKPEELEWVKAYLNKEKVPSTIYPTDYDNIFDCTVVDNENRKFLITRRAVMDYMALPHNYEHGLIARPFQSLLGALRSVYLNLADPNNKSLLRESGENADQRSTYTNHVNRCAFGTVSTVINHEDIELVTLVKNYYSRQVFENFQEKGLSFHDGEKKVKALIAEQRKNC